MYIYMYIRTCTKQGAGWPEVRIWMGWEIEGLA